jgi:tetratricopeptide (TPR) repeat protein
MGGRFCAIFCGWIKGGKIFSRSIAQESDSPKVTLIMKKQPHQKSRPARPRNPLPLLVGGIMGVLLILVAAGVLLWPREKIVWEEAALGTPVEGTPAEVQEDGEAQEEFGEIDFERSVELINEGNEFLEQNKPEQAAARFRAAVRANPEDEDAHYNLAIALARQGKHEEAVHHYEEALRLFPEYAEAHNNLGNVLVRLGRFSEAQRHFEQAIEFSPDNAWAHNNLGTALARQARVSEAILHFQKAIQIAPDYLDAHFNLGRSYSVQGRDQEAIAQFQEVLRLRPGFEPALRALMDVRDPRTGRPAVFGR